MTKIQESDILIIADSLISEVTEDFIDRTGSEYDPVADEDKTFGPVPPDIRRMFATANLAYARSQEYRAKAAGALTTPDKVQAEREGILNFDIHQVVEAIAFAELRRELGSTVGLSVRKGWIA